MKELKEKLNYLLSHSNCDPAVIEEIRRQPSIAPFDTEGRLMAYLLSTNSISYRDYVEISNAFLSRNLEKPQYLDLYEMAPRTFGQTWGGSTYPKAVSSVYTGYQRNHGNLISFL